MPSEQEEKSGNGSLRKVGTRIVEAIVIGAIVTGVSVWANSKVLEVKMDNLCAAITKIETAVTKMSEQILVLEKANIKQDGDINLLFHQSGLKRPNAVLER